MSRTQNSVRAILSGIIRQVLNVGLPFITRTVLLYVLGTEYLGLSGLFSSLLSFLSLAELGVSNALVYSMYRPVAENDVKTTRALLALYRKLYRIIGTVILVAGLAFVPFLHLLIKGDVPADINLYLLYGIYLFNTVCSYFLFAYRGSLLTAHQRVDVDNIINSVIPMVTWVAQMLMLLISRSYYAYIIFVPVSTVVTNSARLFRVKKLYPDLYAEGKVEPELEASIYKKMKALLGAKISTTVLHSSDNIVISAFISLTMVTIYGNYHYIMSAIGGFMGIIYSAICPSLGNSLVTESVEKNYRDFMKLTFINLWLVGWCAVCLLCLYQPFMKLWAGEDLLLPFSVVVLIVIYFVMYQGRRIATTYKDAAGIWWEDRFRPFVMAATNLISNLILVQFIGIWGIILSTILSLFVSLPWETHTVFKYVFKRSAREYWLSMLQFGIALLIAAGVTLGACQVVSEGIMAILVRGGICAVVPNVIFFLAFRKHEEFAQAKQLVLRLLKR